MMEDATGALLGFGGFGGFSGFGGLEVLGCRVQGFGGF